MVIRALIVTHIPVKKRTPALHSFNSFKLLHSITLFILKTVNPLRVCPSEETPDPLFNKLVAFEVSLRICAHTRSMPTGVQSGQQSQLHDNPVRKAVTTD